MAKTTTASRSGRSSAKGSGAKTSPKASSRKGSGGSKALSGGSETNGAADALIKLIESPLVAELLAVGASAALAALTAERFGRRDEERGTRRALKTAAKSAAAAMGHRLSTEIEEIRKAAKKSKESGAG